MAVSTKGLGVRDKPACLIVCSSHSRGVTAQSFIHAFTLTSSTFNVFLATPEGKPMDFVDIDDNNRQWVTDFNSKSISMPHRLEAIDASKFIAVLIPSCPGAPFDLANSQYLAAILNAFLKDKKPVCAVGFGVSGLFCTADKQSHTWPFKDYSLTAPSVAELAKRDDFPTQPFVPSEFIRKHGASYSATKSDSTYVVIDNHVVSGQSVKSTLTAVQNIILLSNARLTKQR
ncbi:glutamine amidotransferase-like class 1 domain-containing protein 1 [Halichondria panicea]|uniref:glutamine amidotransferase-like class 1 domain-containing protein 1 n=1 Tax=Halichondria panicea TaxID=6063 RepID=UPI00312B476E